MRHLKIFSYNNDVLANAYLRYILTNDCEVRGNIRYIFIVPYGDLAQPPQTTMKSTRSYVFTMCGEKTHRVNVSAVFHCAVENIML